MSESRSKLQLVKGIASSEGGAIATVHGNPRSAPIIETSTDPSPSAVSVLSISNVSELTEGERSRVLELARGVAPNGEISGVIRGPRSWDLRPLIRRGDSTLILRLYGPEVMLSHLWSERALKQLRLIADLRESSSGLIEFGTLDSQIFTLRPLYANSIAERLSAGERFSFRFALGVALELVRILKVWQAGKIVHGHLSPSNICFSPSGEIVLVDAVVAITQYLACKELNSQFRPNDEKYIAPELLKLGKVEDNADNYSLGLVLVELFRKVRRAKNDRDYDPELDRMNSSDVEAIAELTSGLSDLNSEARAPLEFAERLLHSRTQRLEPIIPISEPVSIQGAEPPIVATVEPSTEELPSTANIVVEDTLRDRGSETDIDQVSIGDLGAKGSVEQQPQTYNRGQYAEMGEVSNLSSKIIKGTLIVLILVCVFLAYRTFLGGLDPEFIHLTQEELQADWDSGIPSEMSLVAAAAVQSVQTGNPEQQKQAERIIVKSAISGDRVSDIVNFPLLRLAFNEKWERRLNSQDRRVALTIALKKLIDEQYLPKEKVDLSSIYPGVIFAIMAVEGNVPGLNLVPVSHLTTLPPPINLSFQELVNANPEIKCSDPAPLGLARFYTKELVVKDVIEFLREDTETRLRALAILLYSERLKSKQLIEMLLNHPNLRLDHELIRWGIKVNLINWSEVDSSGQLFILAGLPVTNQLTPVEYVQMLAHPNPRTRQEAIEKIINLIPLAHPGAVPFLNRLKEKPERLTGKQTLELAQFLEKPNNATKEAVQTWCETHPNPDIMAELLASTARQPKSTPFDSNLSLCLQHSNWTPSVDILRRLAVHPDDLTRIFVYTQLAELGKKEPNIALEIFGEAMQVEKREDLRRQIQLNISSLKLK